MIYVDTSIFVASLTAEPRTHDAQGWLGEQNTLQLHSSDWMIIEFSSALSIKVRTGVLQKPQREAALRAFRRLTDQITILPVSRANYRQAAHFTDHVELTLKGPDALHLAVAMEYQLKLYAMDRKLVDAAAALGADAELL